MDEAKVADLSAQGSHPSVEQLRRDQRQRWEQGERRRAEAYVAAYPLLQSDAQGMLDLVLHEVELRAAGGETPPLEEYLERFPQFTEQLRQHFEFRARHAWGTVPPSFQLQATRDSDGAEEPIFQSLRALPPAQLPTVEGYEILGILGRGGMGIVYKARQLRLKRLVAIKMILSGAHAGSEALARFRVEAEAVARLQHPNIVQIYEVGDHDGMPYCALEFVDGTTLDKQIAGQPQSARAAAAMLETLARAMHVAHQHQIVHRDLKPANVLVSTEGVPKITDFGLAKRLEGEEGLTVSDAIMGTPRYMAPEQAWGRINEIGPHSDVHALGAILYEMLIGRPAFEAASMMETLELVRNREPVPPRRLQPHTPADLETICLKCLEKEIPRRYASAEALAEDLRRFLENRPILARPVRWPTRLVKWGRRRPLVATLSGVLVLGLVVSAAGMSTLLRGQQQEKSEKEVVAGKLEVELAKTRSNFQYFGAITNGRGTLEGVGPVLKDEQVRRRQVSYGFTTRGGRVEVVEVHNGRGKLTTKHSIAAFIDDLFERPQRPNQECRYESERNQKGLVVKETGFDRAGNKLYEFNYDPEKNIGHYVNGDGFPLARAGTGAAYVRFVWTEKNLQKEIHYLDKDGKRRAGLDATYGLRLKYNDQDLPVEVTLLDAQDQPTENRHSFARMTMAYDDNGQLIEKAFFGIDGRPQTHREGYTRIKFAYDAAGNEIVTTYYGLDGRPRLNGKRFARRTMMYDESGNRVEEAYWGLDGQPTLHALGYTRILSRYDDNGNGIETTFLGLDGQPVKLVEGYAKTAKQYDADSNLTEEIYFGPGGQQVPHRQGYAKYVRSYEAHGNVKETAFLGLDDNLILHREENYARKTLRYDGQGNLVESAFFGTNGHAILHRDGYAKITELYDEWGNSLEKRYLGPDGQPILHRDGYAKVTWARDAEGNLTEEAFWDREGKPVRQLHRPGRYARAVWTYDRRNHCIDVAYLDEAGKSLTAAVNVWKVLPGGEGERLGLMPGDVLYKYAGKVIPNHHRLETEVHAEPAAGEPKLLQVIRNSKGVPLEAHPGWLHGVELRDFVPAAWHKPQ